MGAWGLGDGETLQRRRRRAVKSSAVVPHWRKKCPAAADDHQRSCSCWTLSYDSHTLPITLHTSHEHGRFIALPKLTINLQTEEWLPEEAAAEEDGEDAAGPTVERPGQ